MEYFAPVPYFVWFRKHPEQGLSTDITAIRFQRLFEALMDFFSGQMNIGNNLKIVGEYKSDNLEPLYYLNLPDYCIELFFFHGSCKWLVSVRSTAGQNIELDWDGIIDPSVNEQLDCLQVPGWIFGSYNENPKEFSFSINSSQIYTVMLYLTKAASKYRR